MKYVIATVFSTILLFGVCFAAEKGELKNQKDKESYSLGYQFGRYLKAQGLDINMDAYASGIKDALGGTTPMLSQEEINETASGVQQKVAAARQREIKQQADRNLSEGRVFMEANGKKEGVKTLASGLQYKVLMEGSGRTPKSTDEVAVNYKGALIDGTEFDSSYKKGLRQPFASIR